MGYVEKNPSVMAIVRLEGIVSKLQEDSAGNDFLPHNSVSRNLGRYDIN